MAVGLLRAVARAFAAALRGVERFIDRDDDVGNGDVLRATREVVTAARAAHGFDDFMPAQLPNSCSR